MTISQAFMIYWPLIIALIGGIVSLMTTWVNLNNKITTLKDGAVERGKEISVLQGRLDAMTPDVNTIKTDIAVIKNDISYIKGALQVKPTTTNNISTQ